MCSCSDTGNMQLPYNSLGSYLIHVLFSQCVYFPINGPGWPSELKAGQDIEMLVEMLKGSILHRCQTLWAVLRYRKSAFERKYLFWVHKTSNWPIRFCSFCLTVI